MFTLALSFLIFAVTSFKLISRLIVSEVESRFGADIYINSDLSTNSYTPVFLDEKSINDFL